MTGRASASVHARRHEDCGVCGRTVFGNGGKVAHARSHVRAGVLVELVMPMPYPFSWSRIFLPAAQTDRIAGFVERGYQLVEPPTRGGK